MSDAARELIRRAASGSAESVPAVCGDGSAMADGLSLFIAEPRDNRPLTDWGLPIGGWFLIGSLLR